MQRIGRAGHWRGAIPKGRIFATTRDELFECAALVRAIRMGDLDKLAIPEQPLDILAQQIVAMCAAEDWSENELFECVRRAYPYRNLSRADFDEIIEMLSEGIASARGRYAAYLHRDRVNGMVRGRRGSRLAAITSGGAIPDNSLYTVVAQPESIVVGTVDEDFAVESMAGDVMLLGNTSWRIRRVQASGSVLVEDAQGASPTVPFWRGEAPARTDELSAHVADLREKISDLVPRLSGDSNGKASDSRRRSGDLAQTRVRRRRSRSRADCRVHRCWPRIARRGSNTNDRYRGTLLFDESGGMQLVIHALFGGRINKAWGLALRKRFCRSFNFELQAAATENGLNISLSEQHSFPLADVFHFLHPNSLRSVLEQAAASLRRSSQRAGAGTPAAHWPLLRFRGGKKVPPPIQRMRADDLLAAVFPEAQACQENIEGDITISNHPLIREVMKDVLTEALDIEGLERVLSGIADGRITCIAVDTPQPSQFSHEILNANPYAYLDDAPLEERRARAVEMRRMLPEAVLGEIGRLDPAAIAEVCDDAWPDVRDAEELHDALLTLIALPASGSVDSGDSQRLDPLSMRLQQALPAWSDLFEQLMQQNRVIRARQNEKIYWVAAERVYSFTQVFPSAQFDSPLPDFESPAASSKEDALLALVTGWIAHSGPVTDKELATVL